jgi:hypothetical protein
MERPLHQEPCFAGAYECHGTGGRFMAVGGGHDPERTDVESGGLRRCANFYVGPDQDGDNKPGFRGLDGGAQRRLIARMRDRCRERRCRRRARQ